MSPRTGRPKKENAIVSRVSVRLDSATLSALEMYCQRKAMTKGEVVRKALALFFDAEK